HCSQLRGTQGRGRQGTAMTRATTRPSARPTSARRTSPDTAGSPAADRLEPERDRLVAWVMTATGTVGALAAFALMVEKVLLLQDPAYVPTCSINPLLSCGSVMASDQAHAFGFPNPLIGLALFPVLATVGVLVLAGATPPRWVWLATQGGVTFGVGF